LKESQRPEPGRELEVEPTEIVGGVRTAGRKSAVQNESVQVCPGLSRSVTFVDNIGNGHGHLAVRWNMSPGRDLLGIVGRGQPPLLTLCLHSRRLERFGSGTAKTLLESKVRQFHQTSSTHFDAHSTISGKSFYLIAEIGRPIAPPHNFFN
jgi:hypothetical protein